MSVDTRLFTADELLRLPDDGTRYELVQGELRKMSPAGTRHGKITMRISTRLAAHVEQQRLGEVYSADTGFRLTKNPDTVRAPDVSFVRTRRVVDTAQFYPGAPDLAIEVISPSDTFGEVAEKVGEYLRAGTPAVVVVEPQTGTVTIHRSSGLTAVVDVLAVDDIVPGWSLPLADIFAN